MNKITKIFAVMLSSALVSLSAVAGELSVTGGATATYKIGGAADNAGKGIGVSNELDFNANGELDNGFTWKWQTQLDNATTVNDDSRLEVGTPYGTLGFYVSENDISTKLGYGIGAMGVGSDYTGPATVEFGATMNSYNNIGISSPAGLLPFGMTVKAAYAPHLSDQAGNSAKADGTVGTGVGHNATAFAVHATPMDGLKVGADYHMVSGGPTTTRYAQESGGVYTKYTTGPFAVGLARAMYQPRDAFSAAGSVHYVTDMYGIQFAVNDALSISYSEEKSARGVSSTTTGAGVKTASSEIEMDITHVQASYVAGGATLGLAVADADNSDYTRGRVEKTTTLSIAMAF